MSPYFPSFRLVILVYLVFVNHPSESFSPIRRFSPSGIINGVATTHAGQHILHRWIRTKPVLLQENSYQDEEPFAENRNDPPSKSRRLALQTLLTAGACLPLSAWAARPEIDTTTGQLYSPKGEMLSGGSEATRGIRREGFQQRQRLKPGEALQDVYETRFLAYLTRFLLTYDQAAHAWWLKQGYADTWDTIFSQPTPYAESQRKAKFAEFAESVEIGLADYFVGPYGSYASVTAAKAGLNAATPATSLRPPEKKLWDNIGRISSSKTDKQLSTEDSLSMAEQGVLNLCALLKARYTSIAAKRQLAILFSLISSPQLQPSAEIRSLMGEADNATITELELMRPPSDTSEVNSRTSCRRGGGYSKDNPPKVLFEPPPALGDEYQQAEARPVMNPTSRILAVRVTDPGEGYTSAPTVTVKQGGVRKQCEACAILDRHGHVESVLVLDPGFGYGGRSGEDLPTVKLSSPKAREKGREKARGNKDSLYREAKAMVDLEYEVADIEIINGGNGYVASEPPSIYVAPPEDDPDWYVSTGKMFQKAGRAPFEREFVKAQVFAMNYGDGRPVTETFSTVVDNTMVQRLERDPLELIPSSVRPQPTKERNVYEIPKLPQVPPTVVLPSAQYRALDPIFGGVGTVPITKSARSLKAGEYSRLALSGAVCTVIVRTLLNPLEFVKTKIQLGNDEEVMDYAYELMEQKAKNKAPIEKTEKRTGGATYRKPSEPVTPPNILEGSTATTVKPSETIALSEESDEQTATIGTMDMISSVIKLRGPLALFQSTDITFLASLVFGSLGFGATELFRRSFTSVFFSETTDEAGSEFVLLLAAALACVVTSFVATPFETLRVRSMGLVEPKPWTDVLRDFINENKGAEQKTEELTGDVVISGDGELAAMGLRPTDLSPLFSRFNPVVSRELPFAISKFLAFDLISQAITALVNAQSADGAMPVQVGVGFTGLCISAVAGALAGIAGAIVSHPADLILTLTSAKGKQESDEDKQEESDWREVVQDLLSRDGGIANLFIGLPARALFFFMVIGFQFFLYDYVKGLFQVSSDDLSLVLDVFYAVRQGLVGVYPVF